MAGGRPPTFISFKCPNCEALYQLVKVEAGPETTFHDVACLSMRRAASGARGNLILKYFCAAQWRPSPTSEA